MNPKVMYRLAGGQYPVKGQGRARYQVERYGKKLYCASALLLDRLERFNKGSTAEINYYDLEYYFTASRAIVKQYIKELEASGLISFENLYNKFEVTLINRKADNNA